VKKKIQLSDEQIKILEKLPEQGMGYQIVDVFLTNGKILKNRIVLNSSFLTIEDNEEINPTEILKIELVQ